jgi:hypothetical protein
MTPAREGSFARKPVRRAVRATAVVALVALSAGCTRPLVERAIAARGGAMQSVSRDADADVRRGFPGRWTWRFDYRVPDQLRWTLDTYGEAQSVSFDGRTTRYFLGSASLPNAPATLAGFETVVRWTAVTTLDALAGGAPAATVRDLDARELPQGIAAGLEATYADGAVYVLYFDDRDLLVCAEGPIVVPTIASGRLRATYTDFATTDGYLLPRTADYTLDGEPFFRESVTRWTVDDPRLTPEAFAGPPPRPGR